MLPLLRLAVAFASLAFAAGPSDLSSLREGQAIGAFHAVSLYLDSSGAPKGARFQHDRGALIDVLFFDSVPQISISFHTPPDDERGAPHTLEHLLIGKGSAGRKLNTLLPMRMGQDNAATFSDLTNYQFSSAAGPAEFYEILDVYLDALIRPTFTDEEIRREVAHDVVTEEKSHLSLEEAGTVYAEMVSRMEQPGEILSDMLSRMQFGQNHPFARNQGGEPDQIWNLTPGDIRAFHAAHYHLDSRMEMIAVLPRGWSAADFLEKLNQTILRVEPQASTAPIAAMPPFQPLDKRDIRIGAFPSQDSSTPQQAAMGWPPVPVFSVEEQARLDIALELLSGDLPFLAGDYLDKVIRKSNPSAPSLNIGIWSQSLPASYAYLYIFGLPASALTPATLGALRDAVMERVRWLHDLKPGAQNLADVADKARTRILLRRRASAKAMEGPPRFGERSTGTAWHRILDRLAVEPGFAKHIDETAALDQLSKDLDAGLNPWAAAIERAGMLEQPYVSAVVPDPSLQATQKSRKTERIQAKAGKLMADYALQEQPALERYRAEASSATVVLESLERGQPRPSFLREPPLELDRLDWTESRLPSGPSLVATRFDTPFTDVSIAFDLNGIAAQDQELLPFLSNAIRGVGVVTATGEQLDPVKANERASAEIQGIDVDVNTDGIRDLTELTFTVHASTPGEIDAAVGWLENYILRPDLSVQSRENLKSSLIQTLQTKRAIFQGDEETWVDSVADAYRHQDHPMTMHTTSPFTVMRDLNRLRWRLEEPSPAQFAVMQATAAFVLQAAAAADRKEAEQRLLSVSGEFGEYVRWEFAHLPDDSWRRDLKRIVAEYLEDLGRSQETIRRVQALTAQVLVRAGARVHVNGSPANVELASKKVDALLARLPVGKASRSPKSRNIVLERLRERFPGLARPAHVALVNESGKTGSISVWARAPSYRSLGRDDLLDTLALGVLSGGGAQSLYMRTWNAGLAYSNGLGHGTSNGLADYSAEKCPDPTQTLRFVAGVVSGFQLDDPFFLEYSLADEFNDYRAAQDFSSRGAALADDLRNGDRPETVRAFKSALLRLAREPGTLDAVRARFQTTLGRILVGLPGGKVSASPEAAAFFIGPEEQIKRYEDFVRERGEATRVIRLYPRDFWP
jgi:hypothetical protein